MDPKFLARYDALSVGLAVLFALYVRPRNQEKYPDALDVESEIVGTKELHA